MPKEAAKCLPEYTSYVHARHLKSGEKPPGGPCYTLSEKELEVLRESLKKMGEIGKIRWSTSLAAALILVVLIGHSSALPLCFDYQGINKIIITNSYPLPSMS
jgi:hypothetical protein